MEKDPLKYREKNPGIFGPKNLKTQEQTKNPNCFRFFSGDFGGFSEDSRTNGWPPYSGYLAFWADQGLPWRALEFPWAPVCPSEKLGRLTSPGLPV